MSHGIEADRCVVLDIELDIGPRAAAHAHPVQLGQILRGADGAVEGRTLWASRIGAKIVEAGVSAVALEHAAAWLRSVREEG